MTTPTAADVPTGSVTHDMSGRAVGPIHRPDDLIGWRAVTAVLLSVMNLRRGCFLRSPEAPSSSAAPYRGGSELPHRHQPRIAKNGGAPKRGPFPFAREVCVPGW